MAGQTIFVRHRWRTSASVRITASRTSREVRKALPERTSAYDCSERAVTISSLRKTPRLSKNPMRESETERTPPTLVSHILVRRVRGGDPRQHPTRVEVGMVLDLRFCGERVPRKIPGRNSDCCRL